MTDARRRFGRDWGIDHLSLDAAVAFVDDELSAAAHSRAERHIEECDECAAEVVAQRQVRAALRAADEPCVPSSLLSKLGSIPREAELPAIPAGLAMTADGELVSVLRPEAFGSPAGLDGDAVPVPGQSRRRVRAGVTAVSGLALGALAFVGLPSASSTPPVQPDRGVLGGSVLGTPNSGTARLNTGPTVAPVAVRNTPTPTPTRTSEPGR